MSRPSRPGPQSHLHRSLDGQLAVGEGGRAKLAKILEFLLSIPLPKKALGRTHAKVVASLDRALASPDPLSLHHYYELTSSSERASASAIETMAEMGVGVQTAAEMRTVASIARARADICGYFADILDDEVRARTFLAEASGALAEIPRSLAMQGGFVDRAEARTVSAEVMSPLTSLEQPFPDQVRSQRDFARELVNKHRRVTVARYLAGRAAGLMLLALALETVRVLYPEMAARQDMRDDFSDLCVRVAACAYLGEFYDPDGVATFMR